MSQWTRLKPQSAQRRPRAALCHVDGSFDLLHHPVVSINRSIVHLPTRKNDHALAVFVMKLVTMVLASRMLGFVAAVIAFTPVARQRCTTHCECQYYSKD
jgi:hypothetical protein